MAAPHLSGEDKVLIYLMLAYFLVACAAFLIHGNKPKTLDQASRYLFFIPILVLLLRVPPSSKAVWSGLVLGAISAFGLALWQRYAQSTLRPDGFMTSAIPFGNLSLMAGILCLAGTSWANTYPRSAKAWKLALYMGFLAGLYVSILSGSRGGWLAIPLLLTIFFITTVKKNRMKATALSGFLTLAVVISSGIVMREEIIDRYDNALAEIHDYASHGVATSSVGVRLEAWRAAMMSIADRPILGWSHKDYDTHLQQLAIENKANLSITTLSNTHNNFLEVWLHQGLLGFIAFLALFAVPLKLFSRRLRSTDHAVRAFALGGVCLALGFFVFSLTQVILGRNNGVIFFWITLVIFWGSMRDAEKNASALKSTCV